MHPATHQHERRWPLNRLWHRLIARTPKLRRKSHCQRRCDALLGAMAMGDGNVKAIELERLMRQSHVKMKLVLDKHDQFVGIVTLADITEQKILQRVVQLGLPRSELLVVDMMQPKAALQAFDYHELKVASVKDVVDTLQDNGKMHCLVIDKQQHEIRGVISVSDIARILRVPLDIQSQPSFAALSHIIAA